MPKESKSWWQTILGILTAMAGLITAITGLIVALCQQEVINCKKPNNKLIQHFYIKALLGKISEISQNTFKNNDLIFFQKKSQVTF